MERFTTRQYNVGRILPERHHLGCQHESHTYITAADETYSTRSACSGEHLHVAWTFQLDAVSVPRDACILALDLAVEFDRFTQFNVECCEATLEPGSFASRLLLLLVIINIITIITSQPVRRSRYPTR